MNLEIDAGFSLLVGSSFYFINDVLCDEVDRNALHSRKRLHLFSLECRHDGERPQSTLTYC